MEIQCIVVENKQTLSYELKIKIQKQYVPFESSRKLVAWHTREIISSFLDATAQETERTK